MLQDLVFRFLSVETVNMSSSFQNILIESAIASKALKFGEFTLKSGRLSPYFFNSGLLYTGQALAALAGAYAKTIIEADIEFDIIFGPAYKGIALAAITAAKLAELNPEKYNKIEYAYNRKEAKDHGEGGVLVGAPLAGKKILILDDIITAGTAIQQAYNIISDAKGTVTGIFLCMDRQEKGTDSDLSAVQVWSEKLNVPIKSIFNLEALIAYLVKGNILSNEEIASMEEYRKKYAIV
ncbi:orotate phosphoribosyltransferase URA5 [Sugiyamaella lignohabitans]|uniref:orotate phosphoribosyltransferase n=1 Tax=Sugiyamaella lignohabitans TaxID=796027 RepID=A0A167CDF5_9ASCO|nr:orotate phosphoribosyltransferase URA5 [Sugiyamaella lignohabitans]ANB11546.1 orotate phosphoribosyltransferase URA5 [Sugiyamaella lignohabitans]